MSPVAERFAELGIVLPVRPAPELGVIEDAEGNDFATIDVNNERSDEAVAAITAAVADAINIACRSLDRAHAVAAAVDGATPRRPLIDLRSAPSAMEQRFGGSR